MDEKSFSHNPSFEEDDPDSSHDFDLFNTYLTGGKKFYPLVDDDDDFEVYDDEELSDPSLSMINSDIDEQFIAEIEKYLGLIAGPIVRDLLIKLHATFVEFRSQRVSSEDAAVILKNIDQLFSDGSNWNEIIGALIDNWAILNEARLNEYISRIGIEISTNDSFLLSAENEDKLTTILLELNTPESCEVLEKLLLFPKLQSQALVTNSALLNAALYRMMKAHDGMGTHANWLIDFLYLYVMAHSSSFEKCTSTRDTIFSFSKNNIELITQIVERILNDGQSGVESDGSKHHSFDQLNREDFANSDEDGDRAKEKKSFLKYIAVAIFHNPALILSLPNKIKEIFRANSTIDENSLILIINCLQWEGREFNFEHLENYVYFALDQFENTEEINKQSVDKLKNVLSTYGKYKTQLSSMIGSSRTPTFIEMPDMEMTYLAKTIGRLVTALEDRAILEEFILDCAQFDRDIQQRVFRQFLKYLFDQRGIDISSILTTVDLDPEKLRACLSFLDHLNTIQSDLDLSPSLISELFAHFYDKNDPLSFSTILDFFNSQETAVAFTEWTFHPDILLTGMATVEILFAIYYYWSLPQIVETNAALTALFRIPKDQSLIWDYKTFSSKPDIDALQLISQLAATQQYSEYVDKFQTFADEQQYNAAELMKALLGFNIFLEQIQRGEFETIPSTYSIDLVASIETEWFQTLINASAERLANKEGFADIATQIEEILQSYETGKDIDEPSGVWKHRAALRRDGSLVEDQHIELILRQNNGNLQLHVEFKLTQPILGNVVPQIQNISRSNRRATNDEDSFAEISEIELQERIDALHQKLKEVAKFCPDCQEFHDNYTDENISIDYINDLGFTQHEYNKLIKQLMNWQQLDCTSEVNIEYFATPEAVSRFSKTKQSCKIQASCEFRPNAGVSLALIDGSSALRGYHGTVAINLDAKSLDARQITLRLFAALSMMKIENTLAPVTKEAMFQLARNRYIWHRKLTEQDAPPDEVVNRLQRQDVFLGYETFIETDLYKILEKEGLVFLYSTMKTPDGVAGAFQIGLMSANERRRLGLIRGGWSVEEDMLRGGSDYAFVRAATQSPRTKMLYEIFDPDPYLAIWSPQILDRTDWFAQHEDAYGSTIPTTFDYRSAPIKFFQEQQDNPTMENELCFKKGIAAQHLVVVMAQTEESRRQLLAKLHDRGITHHRGVPVEDCVVTNDDRNDMRELSKMLMDWYTSIAEGENQ